MTLKTRVALALASCVMIGGGVVTGAVLAERTSEPADEVLSSGETADTDSDSSEDDLAEDVLPDPAPTEPPAPTAAPQPTATNVPPTPTAVPRATSTPVPTPTPEFPRQAGFRGIEVNLRRAPSLTAAVIAKIDGPGTRIEVLQPIQDGWYRIRVAVNGRVTTGWMFGSFVFPPDDGYLIAQATNRSAAGLVLYTANGVATNQRTEHRVLVTGQRGQLWRILLPTGESAYVSKRDVSDA